MKENINQKLKEYIQIKIFPVYEKNDPGHNIDHINYVINRSIKFANTIPNINYDMVYVIAAYHDIGHHIDAKNHEIISGDILLKDQTLKKYFTKKEINIMSDAIYDHRASSKTKPRSIYGKIVSSADRNINVDTILKRTYQYCLKHGNYNCLEDIIEESQKHLIEKFGPHGYAKEKNYFKDPEYDKFLNELSKLTDNNIAFRMRYIKVNNIAKKQD